MPGTSSRRAARIDAELVSRGRESYTWAAAHMPALRRAAESFQKSKPLEGLTIGLCLQVTAETSVLAGAAMALGAHVVMCAGNPHTTQDEIAAYLASRGADVHAWRDQTHGEFRACIRRVMGTTPDILVDDGGELCMLAHTDPQYATALVLGGTEETTTGLNRLRALRGRAAIRYPIFAVNNARTKAAFDNVYGTGQSAIAALLTSCGVLIASKIIVVAGYGAVGRGVASRCAGLGAKVVVTEVDPIRALEAHLDGHAVMTMAQAARMGQIFVTCTGQKDVITADHAAEMRDGAILANVGHFDVEIDVAGLARASVRTRKVRPGVDEFVLCTGTRVLVLSRGYVANLVVSSGHPPEIMALSFANQLRCIVHLARHAHSMAPGIHDVPSEIDLCVAQDALSGSGVRIDSTHAR